MIIGQKQLNANNMSKCGFSDMLESAAHRFGHDALFLEFAERRGVWAAWRGEACVYDEHAADALGLALAVVGKVEVVEG